MTRMRSFSKMTILAPALALAAACGRTEAPRADDALRNDLSLATQAQQYRPQQFVSPQELGYQPQNPYGAPQQFGPNAYAQPTQAGYAAGPYYAPAAAPAPQREVVRERVVYRDRPSSRRSSSRRSSGGGGGGYSTAGTYSSVDYGAERRRQQRAKNRRNGALIGTAAGAAIGVATSGRSDRLKGGLIGAVAGGALGAVIGNNQRNP